MSVAGYKLKINGGALVNSIIDVGNVLTYDITGLDPDTDYDVQVAAYDRDGNISAYSSVETATTDPAVVPISVIAHVSARSTDANNVTTAVRDTTGASLIVIVRGNYSAVGSPGAISDSKGNTWTPLTAYIGGSLSRVQIFYCKNPAVGSGHTFSSLSGADYPSICVVAVDQTDTTANAESENGAGGTVQTLQPGSVTPGADNYLIIAGVCGEKTTESIDSGFTILESQDSVSAQSFQAALAYKIQTTAGAENPTWDLGSSGAIAAAIAVFKHS